MKIELTETQILTVLNILEENKDRATENRDIAIEHNNRYIDSYKDIAHQAENIYNTVQTAYKKALTLGYNIIKEE